MDEYLENKRVCLVGPSESLLNYENGKIIDKYDIICRIKKSYPVPKNLEKHLGSKTNILISHLKLKTKNYYQNNFSCYDSDIFNNLDYILFPYPKDYNHFNSFYLTFKESFNNITVPVIGQENTDKYFFLKKSLKNFDPTCGLAGIFDLLNYNLRELHITGITFQKDGFINYYKSKIEDTQCTNRTLKVHNFEYELNFFKELLKIDPRITVDKELQKLIDG